MSTRRPGIPQINRRNQVEQKQSLKRGKRGDTDASVEAVEAVEGHAACIPPALLRYGTIDLPANLRRFFTGIRAEEAESIHR